MQNVQNHAEENYSQTHYISVLFESDIYFLSITKGEPLLILLHENILHSWLQWYHWPLVSLVCTLTQSQVLSKNFLNNFFGIFLFCSSGAYTAPQRIAVFLFLSNLFVIEKFLMGHIISENQIKDRLINNAEFQSHMLHIICHRIMHYLTFTFCYR
jgi:hypothetical protein